MGTVLSHFAARGLWLGLHEGGSSSKINEAGMAKFLLGFLIASQDGQIAHEGLPPFPAKLVALSNWEPLDLCSRISYLVVVVVRMVRHRFMIFRPCPIAG
jgi:hypothetical protein